MDDIRHETERLILRMYRLGDFDDHYKLCADPDVMRYLIGGQPMSRFDARFRPRMAAIATESAMRAPWDDTRTA